MSNDQIKDGLSDDKCTSVYRIQKRTQNGPINTNIYILSFATPFPPEEIYNGCYYIKTQLHISYPMQCKNCYKLNHHTTKNCPKSNSDKCQQCKLFHSGNCKDHKCINCPYDENCSHTEKDQKCPEWCYAYEIEYCMAMDRVSKREARNIVNTLLKDGAFLNTPVHNVLKRLGPSLNNDKPSYASTIQARMDKIRAEPTPNAQNSNLFKEPRNISSPDLTGLSTSKSSKTPQNNSNKNSKASSKQSTSQDFDNSKIIDAIIKISEQSFSQKTPTKRSHSTESNSSLDSTFSKKSSKSSKQLKDLARQEKKALKKAARKINSDQNESQEAHSNMDFEDESN